MDMQVIGGMQGHVTFMRIYRLNKVSGCIPNDNGMMILRLARG